MNRKQVLSGTTIAAFAAILLAWAPSTAYAGVDNMPALVTKDGGCAIPIDPDDLFGSIVASDSNTFVANKKHFTAQCIAFGVPNTTGTAYSFDFGCQADSAYGTAVGVCTVTVSYDEDTETGNAHLRLNKAQYF